MTDTRVEQAGARPFGIVVSKRGPVSDDQAGQAREQVAEMLANLGEPVLGMEMTLTLVREPAPPRPALVQVAVALKGRVVRARAADTTPERAVALLKQRLAVRVGRPAA